MSAISNRGRYRERILIKTIDQTRTVLAPPPPVWSVNILHVRVPLYLTSALRPQTVLVILKRTDKNSSAYV